MVTVDPSIVWWFSHVLHGYLDCSTTQKWQLDFGVPPMAWNIPIDDLLVTREISLEYFGRHATTWVYHRDTPKPHKHDFFWYEKTCNCWLLLVIIMCYYQPLSSSQPTFTIISHHHQALIDHWWSRASEPNTRPLACRLRMSVQLWIAWGATMCSPWLNGAGWFLQEGKV